jgi:ribosomal protein L7/L12/uncharacterized protein YegL
MSVLQLAGGLDLATIPPGVASELRCYLKVRAAATVAAPTKSLVANIALVLDCSASMAGDKCEAAIEAAKRIVDTLDERHRISLVGFASSSRILVDNAPLDARDSLKDQIDKLRKIIGGNTFMAGGIRSGADLVERYAADAKVLVVLSDGAADDSADALAQAVRASELGIQLFAVGIGDDYEADHLRKLATPSSGAVLAPAHLDQLAASFAGLVERIESFIATNARLAIALGDGVRGRRVYKTLPQQAFVDNVASSARGIELRVGSIEREQTHAYLITLLAPPSAGTTLEVARATLTFDVPALGLRAQQQDIALSVGVGAAARTADTEISGAYRRAQIARLVDELADAQRRNAKDECLDRVELLIRLCDEAGDDRMRATYEQLRDSIAGDRAIAQKALNAVVIASTEQAPSGPIKQLYDVVLVAAGSETILLLRALRDATSKSLRELTELIEMTPVAICEALPHRDAEALVAQIAKSVDGAVLEVRPR